MPNHGVFQVLPYNYGLIKRTINNNIRPRDAFRPIARERKYLMDYNGSYTMATKPIKFLELHYTMTQFLINLDVTSGYMHTAFQMKL